MRFLLAVLLGLGLLAESPAEALFRRSRPAVQVQGDRDGLPQKSIWALARDPEGRIWAGTPTGVSRYDGRGWQPVELPLPSWRVWVDQQSMGFLEDGTLWLGTRAEGLFFYRKGRWEIVGPAQGLPSNNINGLVESVQRDSAGKRILYAGTWGSGLARYRAGRWDLLDAACGLPSHRVYCLLESRDGHLWVGTEQGLAVLKGEHFERLPGLPDPRIRCLAETADGKLWIGLESGLYSWAEGRLEQQNQFPGRVTALLPRAGGGLWVVGLGGGLALWDGQTWQRWGLAEGLPSEYLRTLLEVEEDGRRILWIGSDGRGVFRLPEGGWRALSLPWPGEPQVLSFARHPDGSFLMGGQSAGLARFDARGWQRWDPSRGQRDEAVRAITFFRGELWMGGSRGLMSRGTRQDRVLGEREGLPNTLIRCMVNERDRLLWVGTSQGLVRWDGMRLRVVPKLGNSSIRALALQGERLWVGSDAGLFLGENGEFRRFEGFPQEGVAALVVGGEGLWVGTFSGEIHHLQGGRREAMPGADRRGPVRGLLLDGGNYLYAATVRGVERWHLDTRTLDRQFGEEDGLPDEACLAGTLFQDEEGRIWVGTSGGPAVLDVQPKSPTASPKTLWVEALRTARGPFKPGGVVAPGDGGLRVEFALRAYHRERESRYQTQLWPVEPVPSPWGPASQRDFQSLPRGRYTLRVWGRDYRGQVSGPIEIPFRVRGTWQEHPLTLLALALGAAAGAGALARWYFLARQRALTERVTVATAEIRGQKETVEELHRQQQELMGILAHDLRNPVSGIALAAELLQDEDSLEGVRDTSRKILKAAGALTTLLNQFLNLQAFESGRVQIKPEPVRARALLQEVLAAFETQAMKKGQRLELEVRGELWLQADPHLLREVVDNLVSNAMKYSPRGARIELRLLDQEPWARLEVADQGPGLSAEDRRRLFQRFARLSARPTGGESSIGLGLSIAKSMVVAMGGRIGAESEPGQGSVFWLELPKAAANYDVL